MSFTRQAARAMTRDVTGAGDPWAIPSNGSLSKYSSAGVPVDQDSILSLPAVVRCVDIISGTIAGMPFDAVESKGKIRVPVEPTPLIIEDPFGGGNKFDGSGMLTRFAGMGQIVVSLLFRGNAYINIVMRDGAGNPALLQVLNPDAVSVKWDDKLNQVVYEVNKKPFPPQNMIHIRGLTLPGQLQGLSVLSYAKRTIGLGIAAEEYGSMFFGNGAHLSGIISLPGDLKPGNAKELKERFQADHGGMRHAHDIGVFTGDAKFQPISVTPEEAQFLATRQMQNTDIGMLFGIPPHMLGQVDRTTSWGKGIEEQTLGFVKFTLTRWVRPIEDAFSACLPDPQKARFNLDALIRADTTTRYGAYMIARNAGIATQNELRALENWPPVPDGDDLNAPLNSAHAMDPGWDGQTDGPDGPPQPDDTEPPAALQKPKGP